MRLRPELTLALVVALAPLIGAAQPAAPIAGDATPTRTEVREALDKVKS